MTTCRTAVLSLLAATLLGASSAGAFALEQAAPDSAAAILPAPQPAGGADQTRAGAPVEVRKTAGLFPRVLLWTGKSGSVLEKALTELIVKQAFDEDGFYYRTATSAADFADQAAGGLFNIFVIFEADERPVNLDALREQVFRGKSIVIIGPEDQSRLIAGSFGFRFEEGAPRDEGSSLVFSGEPGLGLGGTIPASGPLLLPRKPGAAPAAVYGDNGKPAILVDAAGSGRVIVMPFSIIRSARDAGATSVYSLLLRAAAQSAAQDAPEEAGIFGEELTVTSSADHVRTHLIVTLPQGAGSPAFSPEGTLKNDTILFDLTAERHPQKLRYLYKLPGEGNNRPAVELFYESGGNMVSGGKVE